MRIQAFQGLRPRPEIAKEIASLPYDAMTNGEARDLARANPRSFLHVVRAEVDLPYGGQVDSAEVCTKAKENFERLQADGTMVREDEPVLYLYELECQGNVQRGIAVTCHVDDYENGVIKKHELAQADDEEDRVHLNETLDAHPDPVFMTYKDDETIEELVEEIVESEALIDFTAEDGVRHKVWKIVGENCQAISSLFEDVSSVYIADGHQQAASAVSMANNRRTANPSHSGEEPYNWFLAILFPMSQLKTLPYNRLITDLNGLRPDQLLEEIRTKCTVYENLAPEPEKPGQLCMYVKEQWIGLARDEIPKDPVEALDVSFLQNEILEPYLGVVDPDSNQRIEYIEGTRGVKELEKQVDSGAFEIAFSMFPMPLQQLINIADHNEAIPPKCTWFEPKLRSGLFVHTV